MNRNTSAVPCGQPGAGLAQVSTMPIKKSRSGSKRNESVIVVNLQHCCYPIIHRVSVARYLARSLPLGALCDAARRVGIFYHHVARYHTASLKVATVKELWPWHIGWLRASAVACGKELLPRISSLQHSLTIFHHALPGIPHFSACGSGGGESRNVASLTTSPSVMAT